MSPNPGPRIPNGAKDLVEDALLGQDQPPGVDLDEVARPERQMTATTIAFRRRGDATRAM